MPPHAPPEQCLLLNMPFPLLLVAAAPTAPAAWVSPGAAAGSPAAAAAGRGGAAHSQGRYIQTHAAAPG